MCQKFIPQIALLKIGEPGEAEEPHWKYLERSVQEQEREGRRGGADRSIPDTAAVAGLEGVTKEEVEARLQALQPREAEGFGFGKRPDHFKRE